MTQSTIRENQGKFTASMPVQFLKGVGPAKAKVFSQLGAKTVGDLLEYYPRDWNFISEPVKINKLTAGNDVTVIGMIESTDFQSFRKPQIFEALLSDDTDICRIIWFHGGFLRNQLKVG